MFDACSPLFAVVRGRERISLLGVFFLVCFGLVGWFAWFGWFGLIRSGWFGLVGLVVLVLVWFDSVRLCLVVLIWFNIV